MKKNMPIESCQTGNCSQASCSPCKKKMMIMMPLVIIVIGGYFAYSYFSDSDNEAKETKLSVADSSNQVKELETNTNLSESVLYQDYSERIYNEVIGKKSFAILFYASWCPTCREEEKIIQENITALPKDFVILKADYDKEIELKEKYGIAMQSIMVVLDETGKEIGRISNFDSINELNALLANK